MAFLPFDIPLFERFPPDAWYADTAGFTTDAASDEVGAGV